jgi:hypothetical protein
MNVLFIFLSVFLGISMGGSITVFIWHAANEKKGNTEKRSFFTVNTEEQAGSSVYNERLRGKEASIFDVVLTGEADIRNYPGGQKLFEQIRGFK